MTLFQVVTLPVLALIVLLDLRSLLARRGRALIRAGRMAMCLVAATLILMPDVTNELASTLGIGRGSDLLLYLMLLLAPLAWFQLQTQHAALDRRLVRLARQEALRAPIDCAAER